MNEVAVIIVESCSNGSSCATRDEVKYCLFLKILRTGRNFGEVW